MGQAKARGSFENRKAQALFKVSKDANERLTGYDAFKAAISNHNKAPARYGGPGCLPANPKQLAVALLALDKLQKLCPEPCPAPVFSAAGDIGGLWVKENTYLSWECHEEGAFLWALSVNKKIAAHGHWAVQDAPSLEFVQALSKITNI